MNVGSLFSGIGGLDHGLARAGFRHAFLCESDPWRRTVLAHHFPGVPIYEDVALVRPESNADAGWDDHGELAGARRGKRDHVSAGNEVAPVGLLCGGFPCQDVSVAGRRAGLAGERSGLFYEFARIAESLRPRWLLVENVPGLLSSQGGRDFGAVLGTLADIGYGVAWRILDSRYFGVPQRRRRVFILGALADGDPRGAAERAGEILAVGTRCERHPAAGTEARKDVAVASLSGLGSGGPDDNDGQAGRIVTRSLQAGSRGNDEEAGFGPLVSHALTSEGHDASEDGTGRGTPLMRSEGGGQAVGIDAGVRRLTTTECERLQALPDGWTDFGPDSRRYAALGDAVTSSVAEWIGRRLLKATVAT